ncbi:MAG TPA: VOC family protein [Polyangiaceae bacterium]
MVHPTIMVSDMARARAFYEGRLGLEVVREAGPYLFLRAGSGQLALVARATVTPATTTLCAFEVGDLAATLAGLRARGVVFEEYDLPTLRTVDGIAEVGPYRAAWVRDPDGNYLGIHDSPR